MNQMLAIIERLQTYGEMSLLQLKLGGVRFKAVLIDTPDSAPYLVEGLPVRILFKETEVMLGCPPLGRISVQNRLTGEVEDIRKGEIWSRVKLQTAAGPVVAIITTTGVEQLDLKVGDTAVALIKTNEIMLSPP